MTEIKFIECDCGMEAISVEPSGFDDAIAISFWKRGHYGNQLGFLRRLRLCWQILTTGIPYTDMVCLDSEGAKELVDCIKKWLG